MIKQLQAKTSGLDFTSLSLFLTQISDIVEEHMGGTSGALYTIALTAAAGQARISGDMSCDKVTRTLLTECIDSAVRAVVKYGKAREGAYTISDVLSVLHCA